MTEITRLYIQINTKNMPSLTSLDLSPLFSLWTNMAVMSTQAIYWIIYYILT